MNQIIRVVVTDYGNVLVPIGIDKWINSPMMGYKKDGRRNKAFIKSKEKKVEDAICTLASIAWSNGWDSKALSDYLTIIANRPEVEIMAKPKKPKTKPKPKC